MHDAMTTIASILLAVIGLAIVAVLVSSNAQTGTVLTDAGTAFSGILQQAVSPVANTNGLAAG